jgi:biotin carboxyl carrier protein
MIKFKINTTEGLSFDVDTDILENLDVVENQDGTYHLLFEGRSYNVQILEADYLNKNYVLNVNEKEIALQIKDELDMAIEKMGFSGKSVLAGGRIESPMPGLVLKIGLKAGDEVVKGDVLMILEAMKMENIIKSPGDGIVKHIYVKEGETVAKKQLLLELE